MRTAPSPKSCQVVTSHRNSLSHRALEVVRGDHFPISLSCKELRINSESEIGHSHRFSGHFHDHLRAFCTRLDPISTVLRPLLSTLLQPHRDLGHRQRQRRNLLDRGLGPAGEPIRLLQARKSFPDGPASSTSTRPEGRLMSRQAMAGNGGSARGTG